MFWRPIRRYLITGILILLPVIITLYVLVFAFRQVDGVLQNLIQYYFGHPVPGLGLLLVLAIIFLAGLFGTNVVGRRLLAMGEALLGRIPVVKSIYTAVKQVTEALTMQQRGAFRDVVMVEYPRAGIYSLGFITGDAPASVNRAAGEELVNVFIPVSPPTQGALIMVPRREVYRLEMGMEEGLKLLLSVGIATSPPSAPRAAGRDLPVYRRRTP